MSKIPHSGRVVKGPQTHLLAQAISAYRANKISEAHRLCEIILRSDKKNVVTLHLFGVLEALHKNFENALRVLDRALNLKPLSVDILADKGKILGELGRYDDALLAFEKAVSIDPDHYIALHNRACTLLVLNRPTDALGVFNRVLQLAPNDVSALHNRAIALTDLHHYEDAIESSGRALAINPNYAEALQSRGVAFEYLNRHDLAIYDFKRAAQLNPDLEYLQGSLVSSQMYCCEWDSLAENKSKIKSAVHLGRRVATPFVFLSVSELPKEQLLCSRIYIADKYPVEKTSLSRGQQYQHERIRVAYLSSDFRDHPTAHLIAGLFEQHARTRFEVTAVSMGRDDQSDIRNRILKNVERFIDAQGMREHETADVLRRLEIDILVDLNGYTAGNRFRVLAHRPAPIQISYLAFPGTTGAEYIDYIIADRTVIPEDQREFYSEKTIILPNTYGVNDNKRSISTRSFTRAELGLPPNGFVFCCFNSNYKISPPTFESWMRILKQVEGSVLWLLEGNDLASQNLVKQAVVRGVSAERIIFAKRMPMPDHLARHRLADLFLDTLPYNAHTTASDALWAGLPVLTCLGQTFAGRVAASFLEAICLPELISATPDAYERMAIDLSTQPERTAAIKRKLSDNRLTTPLFDISSFTKNVETAYEGIYRRYQAGLAPEHIFI